MPQPYKYFAFISYSRKDSKVAAWLQKRLEWFRFPVKLVPEDRRPPHECYVRPIYRDKTNLEVTDEHYWTNIRLALEESRYLIVLCSPHAAASEPVNMEVAHFLETHGGDASLVVPVVVRGNVNSAREDAALCPALRALGEKISSRNLPSMVPDAIVAEQDAWEQGFVALVSYLLRLDRTALGDHIQREAKRQRRVLRRWLVALAILTTLVLCGGVIAWRQTRRAEVAEIKSNKQLIETKFQSERARIEEGRTWIERARNAHASGDHLNAMVLAGRSVGYLGFGRRSMESSSFADQFPLLLAEKTTQPAIELERQHELIALSELVDQINPTLLPLFVSHHDDKVQGIAYSPDGTLIASASSSGILSIWDAATGGRLKALHKHSGSVRCLAFTLDGTRLVTGSDDQTLIVWDISSGEVVATLRGHTEPIAALSVMPDGDRVASISYDKTARLWDLHSGVQLAAFEISIPSPRAIAYSRAGNFLAVGGDDGGWFTGEIRLLSADTGKDVGTFEGEPGSVNCLAFSADDRCLASGSNYGQIALWDVNKRSEIAMLQKGGDSVSSVAFSPDGSTLASAGGGMGTSYSDDGKFLGETSQIMLWNLVNHTRLASIEGHRGAVSSIAFSPDGTRLASASTDKTIKIWDCANHNMSGKHGGVPWIRTDFVFSPDREFVVIGDDDGVIWFRDTQTGVLLAGVQSHERRTGMRISHHDFRSMSFVFSPKAPVLASGAWDEAVHLTEVPTARAFEYPDKNGGHLITALAFDPGGELVASGSMDGLVRLGDLKYGKEAAILRSHKDAITALAFSDDGKLLASAASDETVRVWDVQARSEIAIIQGLDEAATTVSFSSGSELIYAFNERSGVRLFERKSGVPVGNPGADEMAQAQQQLAIQAERISHYEAVKIGDHKRSHELVHSNSKVIDVALRMRLGMIGVTNGSVDVANSLPPPPNESGYVMLHMEQDTLAQLANPKLTPARRAELCMELCAKSSQFRAATAQWQALQRSEWPGFEGATVPKDQAPATIPADSPIRRLYLLALIDATKHPQIHGHPTICQTAAQIAPVLTKEMMATPTISLAMMSLMQTLAKDDSPAMSAPRAALLKRLEDVATAEWLAVLRESSFDWQPK